MIRKLSLAATMLVFAFALLTMAGSTALAQGSTETLTGDITGKKTLKRKVTYILEGGVFVKNGGKLIIKPGTTILGKPGSFLVIDKGGKINAKGTPERPIVFTSIQPVGQRARGDWGGVIFNGNAPVNCAAIAGGTCEGEGGTGLYGGNDPDEKQGIMRYVRIEYGGYPISPDNELNGLAFQGVGSGTKIDHIQALNGGDDGFEWFGGTVNAKYLVSVGNLDDSLDWTFGWTGKLQFVVVQQRADGPSVADRGIEADNNDQNNEAAPRSAPMIANMTLVGDPDPEFEGSSQGMELRQGTAAQIRNVVITGFKKEGLRISNESTFAQLANGGLDLQGIILFDNKAGDNLTGNTEVALADELTARKIHDQVDPQLVAPFSTTAPDFRPAAGSAALTAANAATKFNDSFFEDAPFIGAFGSSNDWTAGWTNWASK